jgi:hypothetical protein
MTDQPREINVKIWRNENDKNWSVQMNGAEFLGVTLGQIQALFYDELLDAEESLMTRKQVQ